MFFRDGKLISEKSYKASKARTNGKRSTRKGQVRKTARRAYTKKNNNPKRSKYMKTIPHPSVTGMASGLAIASYLNAGKSINGKFQAEGVIKDVTDGQLGQAFTTLASNAIDMIGTDTGRKTLVTASLVAIGGAFARSRFPQLKLGGSKLYFRI
jgi:hypothetical protein